MIQFYLYSYYPHVFKFTGLLTVRIQALPPKRLLHTCFCLLTLLGCAVNAIFVFETVAFRYLDMPWSGIDFFEIGIAVVYGQFCPSLLKNKELVFLRKKYLWYNFKHKWYNFRRVMPGRNVVEMCAQVRSSETETVLRYQIFVAACKRWFGSPLVALNTNNRFKESLKFVVTENHKKTGEKQ